MIELEALNAMHGDCLLLRYSHGTDEEALWIIDGGPKLSSWGGQTVTVWKDVLLPRLREIWKSKKPPMPVTLGMVSHIDDDHINGMERIMDRLTGAGPGNMAELKFQQFWFNSFEKLVDHASVPEATKMEVQPQDLNSFLGGLIPDDEREAVVESVSQGIALAADIGTLKLKGNPPFNDLITAKKGHGTVQVRGGAQVQILGPLQKRVDALRKEWKKAFAKEDKEAKKAALASLFLPKKELDTAIPNLSSITMLVTIRGKSILLTGDAQGNDLVDAWEELELPQGPVHIDLMKVPHHGSQRNNPQRFLKHFVADHYLFSANGKYDNPDPETIEAIISVNQGRQFKLYFTNGDVKWSKSYRDAVDLSSLLPILQTEYPGSWSWEFRDPSQHYIGITLE